jgi:CRISPR system Cascade subunit CasA
MSRYNLIDEKWIPVRFPDGTRRELGIRDTLLQSAAIEAIEDPSPLVVAGLHRFLLAVLYRALEGPTDINQAKALFNSGFPGEKIAAYLEKWRDRFWLFDEKYPFGQNPYVPEDQSEPWTKLTAEYNATTNKVLFDHTDAKSPGERTPKECARWLLSTMTFSISGGRGYYPSPSPNAMICIPLGRNLHETLCYNLVHYPNREVMHDDSVLWEREPRMLPLSTPKRIAFGYADLYTWQPRMILLEGGPSNGVKVLRFIAGDGFENPSMNPDPMQPYVNDKTKGRMPVRFREDRGTWRDFDSLLPDDPDNAGSAPRTIQNALEIAGKKNNSTPESVLVLGLRYEPPSANVDFWRMERFVLPEALAGDRYIRTEIRQLLQDAEEAQKSLWVACRSFARDLLSRGDRKPAEKDITDFIKQMPVIAWYWSTLESHFHEVLRDYTVDRDPEDIRYGWLKFVRETLSKAWEQHSAAVSTGDAWAIRALVKAEGRVLRKLKELQDEIVKLELQRPEKEDA